MAWPITINGRTYTQADFTGLAYVAGLPDLAEDIATFVTGGWTATSATNLTIGTGAKALTVQVNKPFGLGQPLRVASTASPSNYMDGQVTAYNQATGALTVNVGSVGGAGTFAAWTVTIGGSRVAGSVAPLPVAEGGTGATDAATARTNLGAVASTSGTASALSLSGVTSALSSTSTALRFGSSGQHAALVSSGANNGALVVGGYMTSTTTWAATHTEAMAVRPYGGQVEIDIDTGLTAGNAYTPTARWYLAPTALKPATDNTQTMGSASNRLSVVYAGTSTINTSDARAKRVIGDVPEAMLIAWGEVRAKVYQWLDAIAAKGEVAARRHIGRLAQDVEAAIRAAGEDPAHWALWCADPVEVEVEELEEVEVQATEEVVAIEEQIEVVDGLAVRHLVEVVRQEPVWQEIPLVDADGEAVLDDAGQARVHRVPVMTSVQVPVRRTRIKRDAAGQPEIRYGLRETQVLALDVAWLRWRLEQVAG